MIYEMTFSVKLVKHCSLCAAKTTIKKLPDRKRKFWNLREELSTRLSKLHSTCAEERFCLQKLPKNLHFPSEFSDFRRKFFVSIVRTASYESIEKFWGFWRNTNMFTPNRRIPEKKKLNTVRVRFSFRNLFRRKILTYFDGKQQYRQIPPACFPRSIFNKGGF